MADVAADIKDWSVTAGSNTPADATTIGAGLADNLQQIQATVRAAFAHKGSDIVSAASIDLGAVPGYYHDITGSTGPITSFGTVSAGVSKILQFDSTPTITYNATSMILPGNVSVTMAAGDHLYAMSLGSGNWVVLWIVKDAAGSSPPFLDTSALVRGSSDATKLLRMEADGITTGTTRVWTAPDYDCRIGNLPAGIIVPFGGSSIPSVGWLDCDGTVLAQATYPALYAAIGTTWNIGGEAGTDFRLPNLCGRIAIGSGTGTVAESVTDAAIDTTANSITVASNATKWITGMQVVWTVSGTPPTTSAANQLDNNDTVYVIRIDATTIKFASSRANAQNGTAIDITVAGSGTFTLTHTYTARTLGQYGGEEAHALSSTEELLHGHTFRTDPTTGAGSDATGGFMMNNAGPQNNVAFSGTPTDTQGQQIGGFGGNAAMNIMQPFAVVKYIISY